jgi:hypothetical protein
MLNLLIAIVSDTYSTVRGAEKLTRLYELCNLIYEIEYAGGGTQPEIHRTLKKGSLADEQQINSRRLFYADVFRKKKEIGEIRLGDAEEKDEEAMEGRMKNEGKRGGIVVVVERDRRGEEIL